MITPLDNYLLRAYLDGEMDEATTTAFEIRLMERPDLAEIVEADTLLGMGLAAAHPPAAAANDEAAAPTNVVPLQAPPRESVLQRRGILSGRASAFIAAASLVLAVGVMAERVLRPVAPPLPDVQPVTIVQVDTTRDAAPPALILKVPRNGPTVLAVASADMRRCVPHVKVSQAGRPPLEGPGTADEYGFANIVVDAAGIADGKGEITVACEGAGTRSYSVEFVR